MTGRITAWRWRTRRWTPADYSSVVIPLDQAHLHSHSARCGRTEYEEVPRSEGGGHARDDENNEEEEDDEGDDDPKARGGGDEDTGMLLMSAAEYSIEGLRKEVRRGGRGTRSEYESESVCLPVGRCTLFCRG